MIIIFKRCRIRQTQSSSKPRNRLRLRGSRGQRGQERKPQEQSQTQTIRTSAKKNKQIKPARRRGRFFCPKIARGSKTTKENKSETRPKKISYTDKSVTDNQTATLKDGKITVTNRFGRHILGSYEIDIDEWENLDKAFGNPSAHCCRYITEINKKHFPITLI